MCGFNSTELYRSKLLNSFLFSVKKKWIEKVDLSTISAKHNTSEFMERHVNPMLRGKLEYIFFCSF